MITNTARTLKPERDVLKAALGSLSIVSKDSLPDGTLLEHWHDIVDDHIGFGIILAGNIREALEENRETFDQIDLATVKKIKDESMKQRINELKEGINELKEDEEKENDKKLVKDCLDIYLEVLQRSSIHYDVSLDYFTCRVHDDQNKDQQKVRFCYWRDEHGEQAKLVYQERQDQSPNSEEESDWSHGWWFHGYLSNSQRRNLQSIWLSIVQVIGVLMKFIQETLMPSLFKTSNALIERSYDFYRKNCDPTTQTPM